MRVTYTKTGQVMQETCTTAHGDGDSTLHTFWARIAPGYYGVDRKFHPAVEAEVEILESAKGELTYYSGCPINPDIHAVGETDI